ncbi:hypothetical protein V8J88_03980 [Massilia sp. W12]|uniref:hypothetical protein n=1 Tax=Massilia sp. W12 TaxID=3126507 RepID=UPI0030CC2085
MNDDMNDDITAMLLAIAEPETDEEWTAMLAGAAADCENLQALLIASEKKLAEANEKLAKLESAASAVIDGIGPVFWHHANENMDESLAALKRFANDYVRWTEDHTGMALVFPDAGCTWVYLDGQPEAGLMH